MLKCTKIDFGWSSVPDPAGGAYIAPPGSLAGFKGSYLEGKGRGAGKWKARVGIEKKGGKGRKGARGSKEKREGDEGKGEGTKGSGEGISPYQS